MKIAVISDTHDHLENSDRAIDIINGAGADALIHCGDLCSPFVLDHLAAFTGPVHVVFGNNEGDRFTIGKVSLEFPNIKIHGELGVLEVGGKKIAFTHRPEFAAGLASTGEYSAVFFGHTHRKKKELIGETPLINPGDILGLIEPPGGLFFDTAGGKIERFSL